MVGDRIRMSPMMHDALSSVAPGTALREGLDRIVRAKTGALLVVGDTSDVLAVCSGGFLLDSGFTPQRLSELAKMDGAIILALDSSRIARANVHLIPDPSLPTSETGTRHRTAERTARTLRTIPVLSVSEEMGVIAVYVGDAKHQLGEVPRLLDKANAAMQTLSRYKERLDESIGTLSALEVEDLVTTRDVSMVLQRGEMVRRLADEIETMIVELGVEARLLRLQFDELSDQTHHEIELILRDYAVGWTDVADRQMGELSDEELHDVRRVAGILLATGGLDDAELLDQPLQPAGHRLLSHVPRVNGELVAALVARFGSLPRLLRATPAELADCCHVDAERAQLIKESLARIAESRILDQYS